MHSQKNIRAEIVKDNFVQKKTELNSCVLTSSTVRMKEFLVMMFKFQYTLLLN